MDISIDATGTPTATDLADFTSLRLSGTAPSSPRARQVLADWGIELGDGDAHAHIDAATFARLAGATAEDPTWQAGLARMIAYATDKGWTDAGRIRAHTEWDA